MKGENACANEVEHRLTLGKENIELGLGDHYF